VTGRLAGRRALVVGAGSGIGLAVVEAFVAEGARVTAMELDAAKADRIGLDVVHVGDATRSEDAAAAVRETVAHCGGIDVLVNCVGAFDFYRGLESLSPDELEAGFDEAFRRNVLSQLVPAQAAVAELRRSRGCMVLTCSTSSFRPGRGGVLYVASKFAVRGVVMSLAHELAPEVRVNGVAPGGTLGTDLSGLAALGSDATRLDDVPGRAADLEARTPLHVALTGADHAGSYVFLASDEARGMTGRFLHPDGGMAIS
jgi:NAD(P)-dependent dehydrogenase (short-subunit alcohol dehydrogenase family)